MGIDIRVESESGEVCQEILDPHNLTVALLNLGSMPSSHCVQYVDLYGDTTFNQLQVPVLIHELQTLIALAQNDPIRAHGQAILEMIKGIKGQTHIYVKFYGD